MSGFVKLCMAAGLVLVLAACGARGPLEPPPGGAQDPAADPPFVLDPVVGAED